MQLYARDISANIRGGPVAAEVLATGPAVAMGGLQNWLGQGIEIRNEYGSVVWAGLVNDVRYPADGDDLGVSLDDLYNRIRVIYAYIDATGAQAQQNLEFAGPIRRR